MQWKVITLQSDEILELRAQVHKFIRLFGILNPTQTPCGYSLSLSQVLALQIIEEQMPLTVSKLASDLYLDRSTVSRLIDSLVGSGLVLREVNENNRREVLLSLTEHGHDSVNRVRDQSIEFYRSVLDGLSEDERRGILDGFHKFATALYRQRRNSG